jgi:shikimate kinase
MSAEEKRNIVLCGFMATGKTSIGIRLAEIMHYTFLDLDAVIEAEAGIPIPQIFSSQGEAAFRKLESLMVERVAIRAGCVIATGGGTIVNPQNFDSLKRSGVIITLTADIPTILQRAGSGDDRPMLKAVDRLERIRTLMELRAPAYAKADIVLDTSAITIDDAARRILDQLREFGFSKAPAAV